MKEKRIVSHKALLLPVFLHTDWKREEVGLLGLIHEEGQHHESHKDHADSIFQGRL